MNEKGAEDGPFKAGRRSSGHLLGDSCLRGREFESHHLYTRCNLLQRGVSTY